MARLPDPDEAAAIAAAVRRFEADTAPLGGGDGEAAASPWQRAALVEGVSAKRDALEDQKGGLKWLS